VSVESLGWVAFGKEREGVGSGFGDAGCGGRRKGESGKSEGRNGELASTLLLSFLFLSSSPLPPLKALLLTKS